MKFTWESTVLAFLCIADLAATVWLVASGQAREANPIMGFYFGIGVSAFILAKTLLTLAPIFVLELLRLHRPRTVQRLLRVGILLYVLTYGIGVWWTNSRATADAATPVISSIR